MPEEQSVTCQFCEKECRGQAGLRIHLTREDAVAKKIDSGRVTCLDRYAEITVPAVRAGPLSRSDDQRRQNGRTARFHRKICPWGVEGKCMPEKINGPWCIICRRKAGYTPTANLKSIQQQKDSWEKRAWHLRTKNQEAVPHTRGGPQMSCTNPKKPRTCKFPDKTKLWCEHCRKKTGFTPQANLDKNENKKRAREQAKRDAAQGHNNNNNNSAPEA